MNPCKCLCKFRGCKGKAINALFCFCVSVTTAFLSVILEKSWEFKDIAADFYSVKDVSTPEAPFALWHLPWFLSGGAAGPPAPGSSRSLCVFCAVAAVKAALSRREYQGRKGPAFSSHPSSASRRARKASCSRSCTVCPPLPFVARNHL